MQNGRQVVSGASLSVEPGQVTAILGANGAGKSELVLAIAGVLPVTHGVISVDGSSINGLRPDAIRRAGVAVVPEGHRVLTRLSVDENLRVAASELSTRDLKTALHDTYLLFPELAERKNQLAGSMSGGQQQMLAIGHALMMRPKYLLIDEMSLGLAPLIVKRLVKTVSELVNLGTGVLLVEQFTEIALSIATSVTIMRTGKVQYSGKATDVHNDPAILEKAYF
ncbi:MAG: ATP-binding cassette domain-containing protein [Thiolinea sp.]